MSESEHFDLIVIGGGPGGYVAAIRGGQLGLSTACVEKEALLGGTCLRVGCIPSKALLESTHLYAEAQHRFSDHGIGLKGLELNLEAMHGRKDKIKSNLAQGIKGLLRKNKVTRIQGTGRLEGPKKVVALTPQGERTLTYEHLILATGSRVSPLPGVELDWDRIGTRPGPVLHWYEYFPRGVTGGGRI